MFINNFVTFKKHTQKSKIRKIITFWKMRKQGKKHTNQNFSESIKISSSKNSTKNREKTSQLDNFQYDQFSRQDFLADLQNLDIEPIENTTGDKFVIDEISESSRSYSSNFSNKKDHVKQMQFAQSTVWPDVFYGKKNIMSLLQQRNDVCQMYNLNSKSLKQSNTAQASKRVYPDAQIVQYVKQLFSQSPSYEDYDSMCFSVIPQITLQTEKYFVFMSSDLKFVPQCKICNFTAFLVLNVQKKSKNTQNLTSSDRTSFIKGKILCSFKNCKKSLLGQFAMSHNESIKTKTQASNFYNSKFFINQNEKIKPETEKKKQPQLSERQKMMIKKAAFKINS